MANLLDQVISLAKRRGFIFPGSEIYGGLANTYDYGPLGAQMLKNIRDWWWERFITQRPDIYPLETSVIMSPRVWEASGHTESFTDALVDCRTCHHRTRADHLIEKNLKEIKVEGKKVNELDKIIKTHKLKCPLCGNFNWTQAREFNLLFETNIGIVPEHRSKAYLRGETAQGMFVDFKQVVETMRPTLPFGLAQSGKAFRNEITKGKFIFRTLEFDLAEFEYFTKEKEWKKWFDYWKEEIESWIIDLGVDKKKLRWRAHTRDELSHYSKRTEDLEYKYPFGFKEWCAVAYRTDYDLKNHMQQSGVDLRYTDPSSGKQLIPHVIEPTFGISRSLMTLLVDAFSQESERVVLKLHPKLAPVKVAVFPLLRNKEKLVNKAMSVYKKLSPNLPATWDDRGNIGKRYYSQDEIGTPWCITIDFDTLKDDSVTVRDRDTMQQDRINSKKLLKYFRDKLNA
jgi:glycyl-tRNA synthetase